MAWFRMSLLLAMTGAGLRAQAEGTENEPEGVLTLDRALELALAHSPDLAASAQGILAAEGEARQAGVRRNPELELEASEFGGSGERSGYDGAETAVRVSQALDLGGTRDKRRRLAQAGARLAAWDHEAKRLEVRARTRKAFADLLLAQGRLALAESLRGVAEDVQRAAAERVKAGKVPRLEETKAGVETAAARIGAERARRELETARKRLAASWGGTAPVFKEAGGDLGALAAVPSLDALLPGLETVPEVGRWKDEAAKAGDALALAEAERLPEVTVGAGLSRFEDDGSYAGTIGLSVPLPLFNRNADGIASDRHQAVRAGHEWRAARLRARTELVEACGRLDAARAEAATIRDDLLPGALQAFEGAQAGYREGKYGHLEVLDAQRTLTEARLRHLDVLADCHKAAADVERLTGTPLEILQ
jgi:cobalt-zinc-cadmium efflux system outer membrane protein